MKGLKYLMASFNRLCAGIPEDLVLLVSRIAVASVFWRSVQTKISGWEFLDQSWQFYNLSQSTIMLFRYEYDLPLLPYRVAAYLGTAAEFFFPLLLVIGLGTRLAAFGLLLVTAVIQFLVFPDAWPTHILWAAILLYLLRSGGGNIALDRLLNRTAMK